MNEAGRMLRRRIDNILTFIKHGVINAASESLNAKIQWAKHAAPQCAWSANSVHTFDRFPLHQPTILHIPPSSPPQQAPPFGAYLCSSDLKIQY
jgi:Transposase